jgi:hypothetical protein
VVSSILSPLESPENIIASHTAQFLELSLPRLHLSFFVNPNRELECRSIPGYVVDKIQSCGTMFGLQNKLILCPETNSSEESLLPRRIIIPQGKVSFSSMGDFTSVSINTDGEQHVRWHEYTIDTELGCLMSNYEFEQQAVPMLSARANESLSSRSITRSHWNRRGSVHVTKRFLPILSKTRRPRDEATRIDWRLDAKESLLSPRSTIDGLGEVE